MPARREQRRAGWAVSDDMTGRAVIFDIGATLVFGPNCGPASRIAQDLGLSARQKEILQQALMTREWDRSDAVAEFISHTFGGSKEAVQRAVSTVWHAQEHEATPIDGAFSVLSEIVEAGFKIAILSNIWHPFLESVLRSYGDLFAKSVPDELRFFSYREGCAKPSEEIFLRVLTATGSEPNQTVMIGDSYREDIEPAISLGLSTIWLLHRPADEAHNIRNVVNGVSRRPTQSLTSIKELNPTSLENVLVEHRKQIERKESVSQNAR